MNQIEKIENIISTWEELRDLWTVKNLPESNQRIVYCSEKIAYYKGYLETLKLLDKLSQT